MPNLLKILINPDPVLRNRSKEIDLKFLNSEEFKVFCDDMILTMKEKDGVGLAAPQVGKNIRMFVINTDEGIECLINPVITNKSWVKEWGEEGCLSVPKIFGQVRRHKKLKCTYLNRDGKKQNIDAEGLKARVIQHENDHLDGILFIDKAKSVKEIENINK